MLIRSQDKRMIVNFDNICTVSAFPERIVRISMSKMAQAHSWSEDIPQKKKP